MNIINGIFINYLINECTILVKIILYFIYPIYGKNSIIKWIFAFSNKISMECYIHQWNLCYKVTEIVNLFLRRKMKMNIKRIVSLIIITIIGILMILLSWAHYGKFNFVIGGLCFVLIGIYIEFYLKNR